MDEFEAKKKELLQPLFFEAGAALMDCQTLEYGVALLLYHFALHGISGLDLKALARVMENQDKKTLGQLVSMLKKSVKISSGIEDALKEGLDARNLIIHRILADNVESFPYPEKRRALIKEIRRLRRKIGAADEILRPFIMYFSSLVGVDQDKMEKEVRAVFS
jgi:hypothetical protein